MNRIEFRRVAKSKMRPRIVAPKVTARWIYQSDESSVTDADGNLSAIGVPMQSRIKRTHLQPVPAFWNIVAKKSGTAAAVSYQQIGIAIFINVPIDQ